MTTHKPFNWRLFFILWVAAILGVIAIFPYSLTLQSAALAKASLPLPLSILIPLQIMQNAVLFGLAALAGLFFANRTGFGLPILEAWLKGEPVGQRIRSILLPSIILGVLGTLVVLALEFFVFQPALRAQFSAAANQLNLQTGQPPAWQGLLASFYGGIDEEILLRLLVLTFLAWLGKFISRTQDGRPSALVFWVANLLAAVLFGLGHLPTTAALIPLTPLVILRAVVLNGLLGIAFGYLYWKRGLEAAMLSHFSADLVLHVLLAL
jgi:membrane protease YdiL (CAAX protease family)